MKKLFAMLLALCMLFGAVSAGAEVAMWEFELYDDLLKLPRGMLPMEDGASENYRYLFASDLMNNEYELELYIQDYSWLGLDLEEDPATEQILNVLYWYIDLGLDANQATNVAVAHELQDIGMPDGKPVACLDIGTSVSIGHTDDNYGFLIILSSETGKSSAEMLEIGKQIALSFQRGGVEKFTDEEGEPDEPATEVPEVEEEQEAVEVPTQFVTITGNGVNIRKGATTDAPVLTKGNKGDTFPYLGESGAWYKIDVNGQIGYVSMGLAEIK